MVKGGSVGKLLKAKVFTGLRIFVLLNVQIFFHLIREINLTKESICEQNSNVWPLSLYVQITFTVQLSASRLIG